MRLQTKVGVVDNEHRKESGMSNNAHKWLVSGIALITALSLTTTQANAAPPKGFVKETTLVDSDNDGVPDEWETHGVTLKDGEELPLHLWGADPNKKDIWLQINWPDTGDDSLAPRVDAMDDVVNLFAQNDINLHIDAGDYYSNIPNMANRKGGATLDAQRLMTVKNGDNQYALSDMRIALGERIGIFRGMASIHTESAPDYNGMAATEVFYITKFPGSPDPIYQRHKERRLIIHEMGHTLGLGHHGAYSAGNDPEEPGAMFGGYVSSMSYLYQDVFDYSHERVVSKGDAGECPRKGLRCSKTPYDIPADWDSLDFNRVSNSNGVGRTGVSQETILASQNATGTRFTTTPGPVLTVDELRGESSTPEVSSEQSTPTETSTAITTSQEQDVLSTTSAEPTTSTAAPDDDKKASGLGSSQQLGVGPVFGVIVGVLAAIFVFLGGMALLNHNK